MSLSPPIFAMLLLFAVTLPFSAMACSEGRSQLFWRILEEVFGSYQSVDCSFYSGGDNHRFSGDAAVNVGSGRVTQKLVSSGNCPYQEHLVVLNCQSAEHLVIDGILEPEFARSLIADGAISLGGDYKIEFLLPPAGPVKITEKTDINSARRVLKDSGISVNETFFETIGTFKKRNRFDLMCGCKFYYPDSAGAKS